jgi:hypothetical protein
VLPEDGQVVVVGDVVLAAVPCRAGDEHPASSNRMAANRTALAAMMRIVVTLPVGRLPVDAPYQG